MRQTLALVVVSSVLLASGLTVMALTQSSIADFSDSTSSAGTDTECSFQIEQSEEWSEVDKKCITDENVPENQENEVLAEAFSDELTSQ